MDEHSDLQGSEKKQRLPSDPINPSSAAPWLILFCGRGTNRYSQSRLAFLNHTGQYDAPRTRTRPVSALPSQPRRDIGTAPAV
jgi:hypothetical protein